MRKKILKEAIFLFLFFSLPFFVKAGVSCSIVLKTPTSTCFASQAQVELEWEVQPSGCYPEPDIFYILRRKVGETNTSTVASTTLTSFTDNTIESGEKYVYQIRGEKGANVWYSNQATSTAIYCPPTLSISTSTCKTDGPHIVLNWNLSSPGNLKKYEIFRDGIKIFEVSSTTNSYDDGPNLKAGENYSYFIKAIWEDGNTTSSQISSIIAPACPPILSLGSKCLNFEPGGPQINLSWTSRYGVQKYQIYRKLPGETTSNLLGETTATNFNDNLVKTFSNYYEEGNISYFVQAIWSATTSASSLEKEISIPRCPPFLTVESRCEEILPNCPQMQLSWTGTLGAQGYYVYRNGTMIHSGTGQFFSYLDQNPCPKIENECNQELNCTSSYKVSAVVSGIGEIFSETTTKGVDCETIESPSPSPDLKSIKSYCSENGDPIIEISWQASNNVIYYTIYRNGVKLTDYNKTTFLDTGIEAGSSYSYFVIAKGIKDTQTTSTNATSIVAVDCSLPPKPDISLSTGCDNGTPYVEIYWSTSTQSYGYKILRGTSTDLTTLKTILPSNPEFISGKWRDTSVDHSVTYYYQVSSLGAPTKDGTPIGETGSDIKIVTTPSCYPELPKTSLTTGCESDGSPYVIVSWSTHHANTIKYEIYRKDYSTTTPIKTFSTSTTSWKDTYPSVDYSTTYQYKVVAIGPTGLKSTEGYKSIDTLSCLPSTPILTLTTGCENYSPYVNLSWTTDEANTDYYEIYRQDWSTSTPIATTSLGVLSWKDTTNLDHEATYTYKVVAVGPVGKSESNEESIKTYYCKPPGTFLLNTPFNAYCQGSYPRVDISWTTSSKALYYELYRYDINKDSTTTIFNITSTSYTDIGFGKALKFDGNDYVKISGLDVDRTWGVTTTVEFWMFWTGKDNQMPFGWKEPYDLWFRSGCFGFNTGQGNVYGISSAGLANRWVHVVAMFYNGVPSDKHNALYINGVKQNIFSCLGSTSASRRVTSEAKISGWAYGSGYYFEGIIDEVRIYNRALSDTEVKEHYQGIYKDETGLVGLWHFDEGEGQYVSDSSNYGNNGILGGSESSQSSDPTWVESGIQCNTDYKWTAKAFNEGGSTSSSNSFSTTTPICPPTKPGLVLETSCDPTSTNPFVKVKWSFSIRAQNYEIYRDGVLIATTSQDTDTEKRVFIDYNLEETKTYNYYVKAIGIAGNATSDVISITTPCCSPEKPKNFKAQFECSGSYPRIKLTWDDSDCTEYYKIYREENGSMTDLGAISDTDSDSYTFFDSYPNVKVNTAYTYWIKAFASGGIESPASSSSIPQGNYCSPSTPSITSLTTDCTSSSPINEISWQDDTPFNTFEYRIYRNTVNSIPSTPIKVIASSTSEFSTRKWIDKDPSLSNETTYYYWVESVGPAGSATSSPSSITTLYCGSPTAPNLSFEKAFCKKNCPYLTLSWTTSSEATSYNLYRINPDNTTSTYSTRLPPFTDRGQYALEFDGTADYVKVPYIPEYDLQTLTIELWMKTNAYPSYAGSSYGDYLISIAYGRYLWIGTYASGKNHIQFGLDFENAGWKSIRTYDIPQNKWVQVVATYDGEEMKLFIDGEEKASKTITDSIWTGPSYHLKIAEGYKGLIDEVRIYNRALSESEIKEHYQGIYKNETGLVGMWHFDESEGTTVYDSSNMKNNGKIAGVEWVEGKSGSALDFSGEKGYVDCGTSASLLIGRPLSIEAWIKPSKPNSRQEAIVTASKGGDAIYYLSIGAGGNGKIFFWREEEDGTDFYIYSNSKILDTDWHHIVAVDDGTNFKIYIDGNLDKSEDESGYSQTPDAITSCYIGNYEESWGSVYKFTGIIDEVRIYNRELSDSEVKEHYQGIYKDETGLVGLWHFDEATGTAVEDSSPFNNDGTIKNEGAKWVLPSDAPYYVKPLEANQTYKYFVKAVGVYLESTSSNEVSTTTLSCKPSKPDLKVIPECDYSISPPKSIINLSWSSDPNTEYWDIWKKRIDEASYTKIDRTTQNLYEDRNVQSSTTYEYYLTAVGYNASFTTTSDAISTTTLECFPIPYNGSVFSITTTPTCRGYNSVIKIEWPKDTSGGTIYYNIWENGAKIAHDIPADIAEYLRYVTATNTTFSYNVEAVGQGGNSVFSSTSTTTSLDCESLPPFPPFIFATSTFEVDPSQNPFMQAIQFWWIGSGNADYYQVLRSTSTEFSQIATSSSSTISYTDYTVKDNTTYYYQLIAVNKNGTATSNIVSIYVPTARPGPFALSGYWLEENLIHLSWQGASTTPAGGIVTYELQRSNTSTFATFDKIYSVSCSPAHPSCVSSQREYDDSPPLWHRIYYRVRATNNGGERFSNIWDTGPRTPSWREIKP